MSSTPRGELLIQPLTAGPTAVFSILLPSDPSLHGLTFSAQAVHLGGVTPWRLSNARDFVLGF